MLKINKDTKDNYSSSYVAKLNEDDYRRMFSNCVLPVSKTKTALTYHGY